MTDTQAQRKRYLVLAAVLLIAIAIVSVVAALSRERIATNQRAWFVARLEALIPRALRDNDLYRDRVVLSAPDLLAGSGEVIVFRARRDSRPTAAILKVTAPDGYGGPIELLVGVDFGGRLLGVDVLRHHETQGIGDGFEPHRSDWLQGLKGRSLENPAPARWTIRQDGGEFDQFTGASITPRAILKTVRRTLEFYAAYRERIFNAPVDE